MGKCNADELYKIIEQISPEVIFLEALDDTYSEYQQFLFSTYGVYHTKLEIKAIQKYCYETSFAYISVLDHGLSEAFDKKYNFVCGNIEVQKLIDNYNSMASDHGFQFLNSLESIKLLEELRALEKIF